jgi:hypothetical protein
MHTKCYSENLNEIYQFGELALDWMIILKLILKK